MFCMTSVSVHYYLTSSETARTRTGGAVSRNDEEGFVWIIPCYSDYHWSAPWVVGNYSFFSLFYNVISRNKAFISLNVISCFGTHFTWTKSHVLREVRKSYIFHICKMWRYVFLQKLESLRFYQTCLASLCHLASWKVRSPARITALFH